MVSTAHSDRKAMRVPELGSFPVEFGFRVGASGAHASRTLMVPDLTTLLDAVPKDADRARYIHLIVNENVLGKRTTSNRNLSAKYLVDLYALDPSIATFRLLRFFWKMDQPGRPVLALICGYARDPLLRESARIVSATKPGESVTSDNFVDFFERELPGRFSEASIRSLGQNVAASWAQAGFFTGKIKKVRTRPVVTPATVAYALVLGFLCGLRGQLLLESEWARLVDVPRDQVIRLAQEASKRGWLDFKGAGNVFEINFRQLLTEKEIQASHGAH